MLIQLNTDNNIHGSEKLEKYVSEEINHSLNYFTDKITRIEIHLADLNAEKKGPNDIQCKIEARVEGENPVFVESKSDSKEIALDSAIDKMKATLDTMFGKMKDH